MHPMPGARGHTAWHTAWHARTRTRAHKHTHACTLALLFHRGSGPKSRPQAGRAETDRSPWAPRVRSANVLETPGREGGKQECRPPFGVGSPFAEKIGANPTAPAAFGLCPRSERKGAFLEGSRTWATSLARQLVLRSSPWSPGPTELRAGGLSAPSLSFKPRNLNEAGADVRICRLWR